MRNIFIAFAIYALPEVHADPCIALYASNQAMLVAALQSEIIPSAQAVVSLDIDRQSDLRGVILAGFDGQFSPQTMTVEQQCDGSLRVSPGNEGFTCTKSLNCMPPLTTKMQVFCSDEYFRWADTHCGGRPVVAH